MQSSEKTSDAPPGERCPPPGRADTDGQKERNMTQKQKKEKAAAVVAALKEIYPDAVCALHWGGDPWRLLVMGRLSAQCTDKRVNEVSQELFAAYPTAEAMANADIADLERLVRPCGLFRVKARDIKEASRQIVCDYGGVLPPEMDSLLSLAGVGRKIAHLLRGDVFGLPAVVTDTHCIRICGRMGFYPEKEKTPYKIERIMEGLLPAEESSDFCHRIVQFGRDVCTARSPRCDECPVGAKGLCENRNRALARGGAHGDEKPGGAASAEAGKANGKTGGAPVGNNGKTDGKTEGKKTP